jgi:hypothetical protein
VRRVFATRCTTMDLPRSHYDFSYLTNKVVTLDGGLLPR